MLNRLRKIPALEEIRPNCVAVVQPVECLAAIHSSEGRSVQPVRAVIAIKSRVTGRELVSKHNNCCRLAFAAAAVAAILLVSPGVAWKGGWGQHTELGWRHDAHPGEDEAVFAIELVEIQIFLTEPNRQLVERDSRHLSKHTCIAVRVQPSNVACRMRQAAVKHQQQVLLRLSRRLPGPLLLGLLAALILRFGPHRQPRRPSRTLRTTSY